MKLFSIQTLLMCSLLLVAFNMNAQQKHKEYHDNGQVKAEGQYDANGNGTGIWKYFWENGKLSHSGKLLGGKRDGEWKFYMKNGFVGDIEFYKNKNKVEPQVGCYFGNCENGYGMKYSVWGKTKLIGNFKNGKLNGKGYRIGELNGGVLSYEGDFVNGEKDGYGRDYSGYFLYEGYWKADKKQGKGKLISRNAFDKSQTEYDGDWIADKKEGYGTEIKKDKNGKELEKYVGNWNKDKRHGEGKLFKNGKLIYEGNFDNGNMSTTSGCIDGDCQTGFGVFVFPNKNKYIGEFQNGKKHGKGIEKDPDGNYIIGQWKNDKEDGFVSIYNSNNEIMFSGEMKEGKPLKAPQKHDVPDGCVFGDCANGFGHFKYQDGGTYIGEFKNEQPHGQGTIKWANGAKYVGDMKESNFSGYGREYDTKGNIVQEGMWIKGTCYKNLKITLSKGKCVSGDCANGYGIQVVPNSNSVDMILYENADYKEKYEGLWKNGKRCGFGYIKRADGQVYIGDLDEAEDYHGRGVITVREQGIYYNGGFKDGERHGQGTMIYPDGTKYVGEWDYGEREGMGKEYDANGKLIYEGKFERDERAE